MTLYSLSPEENQVVNLLLIGVFSAHKIAFILDTEPEEIENRIMSIRLKWNVSTIRSIIDKASEDGYLLFSELRNAKKITIADITFYNRFLGDLELVRLTGQKQDMERSETIPWHEINLALRMALQYVNDGTNTFAKERFETSLRQLTGDSRTFNYLIQLATMKKMCTRAN